MEDRKTPRMRQYGESKMTQIMMATVLHVTSGSGLRKFQADGFLFDRVYTVWCARRLHKWWSFLVSNLLLLCKHLLRVCKNWWNRIECKIT